MITKEEVLLFDRILCDVPCSSDGTIRKSPQIAKTWKVKTGMKLHSVQLDIALRSVELLKVGGIMVYSTCSLYPLENEAVVAELLRRFPDSLEIVDVCDKIPDLKRGKGLNTWKVLDTNSKEVPNIDSVPINKTDTFKKSMFPPTEEEINRFHLDRCIRVYPHHQDTGGFFVTVILKKSPTGLEGIERINDNKELEVYENKKNKRGIPNKFKEENYQLMLKIQFLFRHLFCHTIYDLFLFVDFLLVLFLKYKSHGQF